MSRIRRLPLAIALALLSCASAEPAAKTVLMSSASGSIVVLPMNVVRPLPESLAGAAPQAWDALRAYLLAHDALLKTVAFDAARRLWLESVRAARAESPTATFPDAALVFAEKLSAHSEFANVVIPSLFVQGARVEGRTASWDGAERPVEIDAGSWADRIDEETEFGGAVPAASLHVVVLDGGGRIVHEQQSGLVLLARIHLTGRPELDAPGFEAEPVAEPFADREATLAGIARALDPWLTPLDPARIAP